MKKILITLAALSGFFIAQNVFATCSNYTTYTSGQTLTSSSLNSLQSNYTNCINEVLNGDTFTGNMLWYSGSNIAMYSDTGSTLKFSVDGTSGNITTEGQINLGTGGVVLNDDGDGALTITGAGNGSDEDLTLNLDDTSNHAVISSSTGVTDFDLTGMDLLVGGSDLTLGSAGVKLTGDGDGAITLLGLGDGSDEDLTVNLDDTSNTAVVSSSTGVTALGMNAIGMNVYSDSGSTLKAKVEASSGAAILGLTQVGQMTNCGMSVSGSTFTIAGYDGTALSATNPCVVAVQSNTDGRVALAYFTSNVTFTFGAASDTDGNDWGIDNSVDWIGDMPFFVGVIYNGITPYFTISRVPNFRNYLNANSLCRKGDTDCDGQADVMILDSSVTETSYIWSPNTQVGWFIMTYTAATNSWTASVGASSGTGFNHNYEKERFFFPSTQNGASNSFIYSNGGTAPAFGTVTSFYEILRSGICRVSYYMYGDNGTDGSGAVNTKIALPYEDSSLGSTNSVLLQLPSTSYLAVAEVIPGEKYFQLNIPTVSGTALQSTSRYVLNSDFSNGTRQINGSIIYRIQTEGE